MKKLFFSTLSPIAAANLSSNEIKEIFALFDKNNKGLVAIDELGTLVRALNLNPTETEIQELAKKMNDGSGNFSLETLERVIQERGKDTETL